MPHFRPNLSNPFNHFPQTHAAHQQPSHYPHQGTNYQAQHFGGHPSFAGGQQNGHLNNLINPGLSNGNLPGNFGGANLGAASGAGLASQEAQMRFAHGAAIQQQQQQQAQGTENARTAGAPGRIRDVYANNLQQEVELIRGLVERYPYVSMDTEFPGVVARPMGNFMSKADYHYQTIRANVDMLKVIQLGITLWSTEGELPPTNVEAPLGRAPYNNSLLPTPCTWQFNFKFSLEDDMYAEDAVALLKKSGVDFEKSAEMGIDPSVFGSLLITSGLVTDPKVTWLSFHSGYDFGYLVKIMFPAQMPDGEESFLEYVRTFFPKIWDLKFLFRHSQRQAQRGVLGQHGTNIINALGQRSGLQDIADELGCSRVGQSHTAGSDAWLTGLVFWQMRQKLFNGQIPDELNGMVWGINNVGPPASASTQAAAIAGHQTPNTNGATLYHSGMTPNTYKSDAGPSTPQSSHTGLASTPGGHGMNYGGQMSGLTAGGAFSNFQYGAR